MTLISDKNKLKLLKIELPDKYVQENFKRIEKHAERVTTDLRSLDTSTGSGGDTIINVTGAWTKSSSTIDALSSKIIEVVPMVNFHNLDYIFTLFNEVEEKTRRFQLTTTREGAILESSVHGRQGNLENVQVSTIVNLGNAEITIQNNNNFNLDVSFAKLSL